jgi:hypothetical protein
MGPLREDECALCVGVCVNGGDVELALKLIKEWEERAGRDAPQVVHWRMRAEYKARNYVAAIEAADRVLLRSPNHAAAKQVRDEAIKGLVEAARKYEKK